MVNENLTHHTGCNREKMLPVGELALRTLRQFQICFVHQCRRLQCVIGPFAPQLALRDAM